jgi:hypothetical protein
LRVGVAATRAVLLRIGIVLRHRCVKLNC